MANKKFNNYSEINFDNYYKEYGIIEENIKFHLLKRFLNSNKIEVILIYKRKYKINFIFWYKWFVFIIWFTINFYLHKEIEDLFDFFPIYVNDIDEKKEMSNILQTIKNQILLINKKYILLQNKIQK